MLPRLDELESDLEDRKKHAASEGWLGEIEGLDRTLRCLRVNATTRCGWPASPAKSISECRSWPRPGDINDRGSDVSG
jgi:hypothetical protein